MFSKNEWLLLAMNFIRAIALLILFGQISIFGVAQNNSVRHNIGLTIPDVALLGLISKESGAIQISSISPTVAGNSIDLARASEANNIWINYSSISKSRDHQRKIMAMVQGEVPKGIRLFVEASNANGAGVGKLGNSAGRVALSAQPEEIISDIGSCSTGRGLRNGHSLSYKVEMEDDATSYSQLTAEQTTLNIVYTLTDIN